MMPLLLLALLPLDLSTVAAPWPATHDGLEIEAVLDGRRVDARLTNVGKRPRKILTGYTCGGPEPFVAVVDGTPRSFQTGMVTCTGNAMQIETIAPGAQRTIASTTLNLDGAAHRVAVRYENRAADWNREQWHGQIQSATISVGAATLGLELRATPGVTGFVGIEAIHTFAGPTQLRFVTDWIGVCPGPLDRLLVDAQVHPFVETGPCDGPAAVKTQTLAPGGQFVSRGRIKLAPGIHQLRARYEVGKMELGIAGYKGNLGDFEGVVESPEIQVIVR